jgi:hypothetical protein
VVKRQPELNNVLSISALGPVIPTRVILRERDTLAPPVKGRNPASVAFLNKISQSLTLGFDGSAKRYEIQVKELNISDLDMTWLSYISAW